MNKVISSFYQNRKKAKFHFSDIKTADFNSIPSNTNGVYVLVAKRETFLYPNKKKTPVFYIGMSVNLKSRLKEHQRHTNEVASCSYKERASYPYWEKYQYAASFDAEVYVFPCIGRQKPKDLEYQILNCFYKKYLAKPVANGAFSFKKGTSKHMRNN